MRYERFAAAYEYVRRRGIFISCVLLGIVMWTLQNSASPRYSMGHAARGARLSALVAGVEDARAQKPASPQTQARLVEAYGKQPLSFEANHGQADPTVKFLSRGRGYALFITSTEAVLSLSHRAGNQRHARDTRLSAGGPAPLLVHMKPEGGNPTPELSALNRLPGNANYFIGNDPKKWRTSIPTYARVQYKNVYPGIDLVYYGRQGQLEYDFVVAPGADPKAIRLSVEGGGALKVDAQGGLVLDGPGRALGLRKPRIYQEVGGKKQDVTGRYVLQGPRQVGFEVASYDRSLPLTIDPALTYSTYLGGPNLDLGYGISADAAGNAYVAGFTTSAAFPTTAGAFHTTYSTQGDAFVAKYGPDGSLLYSTYLGGNEPDQALAIAVNAVGNAYVAGQTFSPDFPASRGSYSGKGDAFVAELNPQGSALVYSAYLGGSSIDEARAIALDAAGNAYVAGKTFSADFPTVSALQASLKGSENAFVTEVNSSGAPVYSTYLGGSAVDQANGIAVDLLGNAYVAGVTRSSDFPASNAPQGACKSCPALNDAFVAEIAAGGSSLVYSTFLGGSANDEGTGVAVDVAGNAYVTGFTFSSDFPTTSGAFQQSFPGTSSTGSSAFVTKISANGSSLGYSTYLGGDHNTFGAAIAQMAGIAYVTGLTNALNFPVASAIQPAIASAYPDVFLTELNADGSALYFSTYFGGTDFDEGNAVALDPLANAYLTGDTRSANFPVAHAAQGTFADGDSDAIVAKILFPTTATVSPGSLTFPSEPVGTASAPQTVTVTNTGTAPLGISSIALSGTNPGSFSESDTCAPGVAPTAACTITVTFKPTATGAQSATLTLTDNGNGSPQQVSLSGTGGVPAANLSPTSLTYSNQKVGTTSAAQGVTLSNSGSAPLTITSIGITGANSGDFAQTNNCGGSVAAGGSCAINVTFSPTATGARTATLSVADDASGSPQTVSLAGTGVQPVASVSPTSVTFLVPQLIGTTSPPQTVTLSNTGVGPLTVSRIAITGGNSGDFAQTNNCGSSVAAGASCSINVTFTPTGLLVRSSTLTITDDASNGSPQTVSLTGTGIGLPLVTLSPIAIPYGSQLAGGSGVSQGVTLSNTGTAPLTITSIAITGPSSGDFTQTNNCGSTVAAGASCTITATFRPSTTGAKSAVLSVTDDAKDSPQTISLTGTGAQPLASLSLASLTYPKQTAGTTSPPRSVTLSNPGSWPMTISSIGITGVNSRDFGQTNNCGSSLAIGASCTINVTFSPTASGTPTATLSVTDNAPGSPQGVSLTGTAVGAQAAKLAPASVSYPAQLIGTTSGAKSVTLSNPGTSLLTLTSIGITGANSSDFAQTNNCGSSVAPSGSCTINVTFTPSAVGTRTAALLVTDDADSSPQTAPLTGTGAQPKANLSPTSLTYSDQKVGTSSAPKSVTLTNSGNGTLNVSSIAITGANSGDFAQTNNCGSVAANTQWKAQLAVGSSCTINVTFSPTATGTRTAAVSITDNAPGSPQTVPLTGTGIQPAASVSPTSLLFVLPQLTGTTSAPLTVTLSNTGIGPLTVSSIAITGGNSGDFAQTNNCGSSLAAGASCAINVTFTPTGLLVRSSTLTITDDATNGSPQTVSLSGTGI